MASVSSTTCKPTILFPTNAGHRRTGAGYRLLRHLVEMARRGDGLENQRLAVRCCVGRTGIDSTFEAIRTHSLGMSLPCDLILRSIGVGVEAH